MNAPLSPRQIEYWPLAQLKPYTRNANTHDANQVAKIAASMAQCGWTVPVINGGVGLERDSKVGVHLAPIG